MVPVCRTPNVFTNFSRGSFVFSPYAMKITRVEPIWLRLPEVNERCDGSQETLVVKVHTDAGITGVGEVDSSSAVARAIIEAPLSHKICRGLAECVLGQDPVEIDRLLYQMY